MHNTSADSYSLIRGDRGPFGRACRHNESTSEAGGADECMIARLDPLFFIPVGLINLANTFLSGHGNPQIGPQVIGVINAIGLVINNSAPLVQ